MVKSLPPLHDVAVMAGLDLPKFLGDATVLAKLDGNGLLPPPKQVEREKGARHH